MVVFFLFGVRFWGLELLEGRIGMGWGGVGFLGRVVLDEGISGVWGGWGGRLGRGGGVERRGEDRRGGGSGGGGCGVWKGGGIMCSAFGGMMVSLRIGVEVSGR